jgi:hypothetical protein
MEMKTKQVEGWLVDENNQIMEHVVLELHVNENGYVIVPPNVIQAEYNGGLLKPMYDEETGTFIESATEEEQLPFKKSQRVSELYAAYAKQKVGQVISRLKGTNGEPVVFDYTEHNQSDYAKIASKFALIAELEESIIGSASHGKFFISRKDFQTLVEDFDAHETGLYRKFVELRTKVELAETLQEVSEVVWI